MLQMISAEAPVLFAKAAEIFITELTLRAWIHTEDNKRRTLQRNDIAMAITKYDQFDFLIDIVPRDEIKPNHNQPCNNSNNSASKSKSNNNTTMVNMINSPFQTVGPTGLIQGLQGMNPLQLITGAGGQTTLTHDALSGNVIQTSATSAPGQIPTTIDANQLQFYLQQLAQQQSQQQLGGQVLTLAYPPQAANNSASGQSSTVINPQTLLGQQLFQAAVQQQQSAAPNAGTDLLATGTSSSDSNCTQQQTQTTLSSLSGLGPRTIILNAAAGATFQQQAQLSSGTNTTSVSNSSISSNITTFRTSDGNEISISQK